MNFTKRQLEPATKDTQNLNQVSVRKGGSLKLCLLTSSFTQAPVISRLRRRVELVRDVKQPLHATPKALQSRGVVRTLLPRLPPSTSFVLFVLVVIDGHVRSVSVVLPGPDVAQAEAEPTTRRAVILLVIADVFTLLHRRAAEPPEAGRTRERRVRVVNLNDLFSNFS